MVIDCFCNLHGSGQHSLYLKVGVSIFMNGLWQPRCGLGSLGCRNDFPDGLRSPSLAKVIVWNLHRKPLAVQCAPSNYFNEAGELRA